MEPDKNFHPERIEVNLEVLLDMCLDISDNNFNPAHTYFLRDFNQGDFLMVTPSPEGTACSSCQKPISQGTGIDFYFLPLKLIGKKGDKSNYVGKACMIRVHLEHLPH